MTKKKYWFVDIKNTLCEYCSQSLRKDQKDGWITNRSTAVVKIKKRKTKIKCFHCRKNNFFKRRHHKR